MDNERVVPVAGLTPSYLDQIAALEHECVTAEDIRLKLEWNVLRRRRGDHPEDFLWYRDGRLIGFAGLYIFRPDLAEICGMVHPDARCQGVFRHLVTTAAAHAQARGVDEILLVSDQRSASAAGFLQHLGLKRAHSEYLMRRPPAPIEVIDDRVSLRQAGPADAAFVTAITHAAFGPSDTPPPPADPAAVNDPKRPVFVIGRDGQDVGAVTARLDEDGHAFIYGLCVRADLRGQGIGRRALARLIRDLTDRDHPRLSLEVACVNVAALELYRSCGFQPVNVTDYHRWWRRAESAG